MNALASCASPHFMLRASREVARVMEFSGGDNRRILFVEDEADCRVAFRVIFQQPAMAGFKVDFADSVNEAMALIVCNVYDLAILDYQIYGETADKLVAQWRECGYHLPFLVISGRTHIVQKMQDLGSSGFLEKLRATDPNLLKAALCRAIDGYWSEQCR